MFRLIAAVSALALMACEAEDVSAMEDVDDVPPAQRDGAYMSEAEEQAAAEGDGLRAGDYPEDGEAEIAWPIKPNHEEPGGKDALTDEEREALGVEEGESITEEPDPMEGEDPPRR